MHKRLLTELNVQHCQLVHGHIESGGVVISREDDKHVIVLQDACSRTDIVLAMLEGIGPSHGVLQRQRCQWRQSNRDGRCYVHPGKVERVDRP